MTCRIEEKQKGGCYPRSCPTCKFGPCQRTRDLDTRLNNKIDYFVDELKIKLLKAQEAGRYGWDDPNWKEECIKGLIKHVAKGDPLDVAAYAFFCHYHGWPTWLKEFN